MSDEHKDIKNLLESEEFDESTLTERTGFDADNDDFNYGLDFYPSEEIQWNEFTNEDMKALEEQLAQSQVNEDSQEGITRRYYGFSSLCAILCDYKNRALTLNTIENRVLIASMYTTLMFGLYWFLMSHATWTYTYRIF
jgi:hypothetical protein